MAKRRWLSPWKDSCEKPVLYHCISRVVDKRFAFDAEDKEKFRTFMRMYENFSGCRVLSYCLMCNHIHLLLEVPPVPIGGITDDELLQRLSAIYDEVVVAGFAQELKEARQKLANNEVDEAYVEAIRARYTYRMHHLSEYMKSVMQRFTRWYNITHKRSGNLWEDAFKSVIVEDGEAARTMAAYIDLNPVRAGMVDDPAEYRWSSYGEAIGGGAKGNGKKARAGLVRALTAHQGGEANADHWSGEVSKDYRMLLLETGVESTKEVVNAEGKWEVKTVRKGMKREVVEAELEQLSRSQDVALGKMIRHRVRYFTDGAVIGSRVFVNDVFAAARERFGPKRKDGARKMRGMGAATGLLWSARDLRNLKKGMQ